LDKKTEKTFITNENLLVIDR